MVLQIYTHFVLYKYKTLATFFDIVQIAIALISVRKHI